MKKIIKIALSLAICVSMIFSFAAYAESESEKKTEQWSETIAFDLGIDAIKVVKFEKFGLPTDGDSVNLEDRELASFGLRANKYNDRIEIAGRPTKKGTANLKCSVTKGDTEYIIDFSLVIDVSKPIEIVREVELAVNAPIFFLGDYGKTRLPLDPNCSVSVESDTAKRYGLEVQFGYDSFYISGTSKKAGEASVKFCYKAFGVKHYCTINIKITDNPENVLEEKSEIESETVLPSVLRYECIKGVSYNENYVYDLIGFPEKPINYDAMALPRGVAIETFDDHFACVGTFDSVGVYKVYFNFADKSSKTVEFNVSEKENAKDSGYNFDCKGGDDCPQFKSFEDAETYEHYSHAAIDWAIKTEVTNGIDEKHFGPDESCTRGQVATFLWRAAGRPEPTKQDNPFVDISPDDYYYKPILWAVENGITLGTDENHFSPNQTCSSAHIITFLYRAMGIGDNGWYEEARQWASGAKLTDDTGLEIIPDEPCPRAAVVTFLYRIYVK